MPASILLELLVAAIASGVVAPLASILKRFVNNRQHTVRITLPNGEEIHLELDDRLSEEKTSELVMSAIRSAQTGDKGAMQRTIEASHNASSEARAEAA